MEGAVTRVPDSFTHLHLHTEFSMLDGAARIAEVVAKAADDGQPAIAITDHGNLYGVLDFYRACHDRGVKPIIGLEAYQAHESRYERPPRRGRMDDSGGEGDGGRKLYYHLTLLAENHTGYRNLIQLASKAFLQGYWYKPRLDWDLLEEHSDGVIATTGCLGGHVSQALLRHDFEDALKKAGRLQDIFGPENLFVELQDHGIAEQARTTPQLLDIARQLGAPLLATNDSHYVERSHAVAHDALLCVQTGSVMSDPDRFKFHGDEHYLKTADEMRHVFRERPEACDNTLLVAERCNVAIEFGRPQLPRFSIPDGFASDADYLRHLTIEGARRRWGPDIPAEAEERIGYELGVIEHMGFSSYFLIVWDLIRFAREHGIRVGPGRGSAAGCVVAYCLQITDLDPIHYDLLFERFLNPSRISMPDIDMDFDSRYRDDVIRYAADKYGRDHVAQIVTFSTIKARAAVRDAARVLGYPYAVGDRVAKAMPPLVLGRDTPLYACLEPQPKHEDGYKMAAELRQMYGSDPEAKAVIDVAKGIEGLRRQDGIHAAAVVITPEPLTEYLPIQRKPENGRRSRAGTDRHAVRDARGRGPRAAQDGLPRAAQPRRDHRHRRADPYLPGRRARHRPCAARRRTHLRDAVPGRRHRGVPARGRAAASADAARWRRPRSKTSAPWSPCTGRARWRPTCTTSTPTERTGASRSTTSTPTPRSCWPTPTASASTRSR